MFYFPEWFAELAEWIGRLPCVVLLPIVLRAGHHARDRLELRRVDP
jgi:hypothetical protein